jgi:hypothetical protein
VIRLYPCLLLSLLLSVHLYAVERFADYHPLPVAAHLHSRFSDGTARITDLVTMARAAGYAGVWITDHSDVHWQYPVLGTTVGYHRNSLLERGFDTYLRSCAHAQARNPDLLVLPGIEASPYYYWEGSLLGKNLVNHQWMRHLIVAGIEDPAVYRRLPLIAYGHGPYRPGRVNAGEAPYQAFTEAVAAAGGVTFWAHPYGSTRQFPAHVTAKADPYQHAPVTSPASTGIAMHGVLDSVAMPGGAWDDALMAYCTEARAQPPWPMVELDYHTGPFTPTNTLMLLLPKTATPATRKAAALDALRQGHFYVTGDAPGGIRLQECSLFDVAGHHALPGEALAGSGPVTIHYSISGKNTLQWVQLVRNGRVLARSTDVAGDFVDPSPAAVDGGARGYYRLIARATDGAWLVTTPIFWAPEASSGR